MGSDGEGEREELERERKRERVYYVVHYILILYYCHVQKLYSNMLFVLPLVG